MTWMCNADSGVTFPVHLNFKRRFFRERMGNAQGGGGFPGGPPGGKKDGEKKKKKFESKGGPARVGRKKVGHTQWKSGRREAPSCVLPNPSNLPPPPSLPTCSAPVS